MKTILLFSLLLLLPSCSSFGNSPASFDPAWWTLWSILVVLGLLAHSAGYHSGLSKGRKHHLKDLAEEVMHGRQQLQELSCPLTSVEMQAASLNDQPQLGALRIAEIMHDEYHLATGDSIGGVLLWKGKIHDPACLKECNAYRQAAQRVCDAFAFTQS